MCGLAATFAHHPDAPRPDAAAMGRVCAAMALRGPDGEGQWASDDGRVRLGHRRLAILDLSPAGAQPMTDGRAWIVFNGEIYNFRALRDALEADGEAFTSTSDTEVLLRLYARHGRDFVTQLRGMFAFALYDPARRGLLLGRDTYGIKPLYIADDGRTVRVASQVKALLAGGSIDTSPEPAGHAGFFLWGHVPEPFTLYRGIRALPAGHTQWISEHGAEASVAFDSVGALLRGAEADHKDRGDTATDIRAALLDSVRHHLVSDVEVGVFLSAGIDSSTLVAIASELQGRIRTVTLGFREFVGTPNDEVPLAEAVARQYGTSHTTVWVTRDDFRAAREAIFEAMDQPTLDGVNSYFVSRAATEAGLKVALSGVGGDELFGGYDSFRQIPRLVRATSSVPRPVGRAFRRLVAPLLSHMTSPKYASLFEYGRTYGGAYLLRRGLHLPWELPSVMDPELAREGLATLATESHLADTHRDLSTPHARVSALESSWYMRNQLLRDTDWAAMAHSLEIRTPLVDTALTRTVAPCLPSIARGGAPKAPLAAAAHPALPSALLNRPKTGFTIPVRDWMQDESAVAAQRGLRGWAQHVYSRAQSK